MDLITQNKLIALMIDSVCFFRSVHFVTLSNVLPVTFVWFLTPKTCFVSEYISFDCELRVIIQKRVESVTVLVMEKLNLPVHFRLFCLHRSRRRNGNGRH